MLSLGGLFLRRAFLLLAYLVFPVERQSVLYWLLLLLNPDRVDGFPLWRRGSIELTVYGWGKHKSRLRTRCNPRGCAELTYRVLCLEQTRIVAAAKEMLDRLPRTCRSECKLALAAA